MGYVTFAGDFRDQTGLYLSLAGGFGYLVTTVQTLWAVVSTVPLSLNRPICPVLMGLGGPVGCHLAGPVFRPGTVGFDFRANAGDPACSLVAVVRTFMTGSSWMLGPLPVPGRRAFFNYQDRGGSR